MFRSWVARGRRGSGEECGGVSKRVRRRGEDSAAGSRRTRGGGMFGCGTTSMLAIGELTDNASFRVAGAGFLCAMRSEYSGLRCLEIERARRKHGSLVDGQGQRCTLLLQGKRGHTVVDENQPKGGKGCVTLGMRGRRGGCNRIGIFNTAPMATISSCKTFMAQRSIINYRGTRISL
ncbi:hypothetical protein B0H14DRAFT_2647847 [Mycena olivaceomarginata]|nr:hypothetical protein B0H14DRAFT_2647847 [Mycena olivaceomarginata]